MISTHAEDVAGAIARHIAGVESAGIATASCPGASPIGQAIRLPRPFDSRETWNEAMSGTGSTHDIQRKLFELPERNSDMATSERAILAGGCFWGVQDLLRRYDGVISTRVGSRMAT